MMKKLLVLLLTLLMALGSVSCAQKTESSPTGKVDNEKVDNQKVYEFNVSFTTAGTTTQTQEAMMNKISELSGGRIVFNYYYSSSLVAQSEVPKALNDGVVDIAMVALPMYPSQLAYSSRLISMPFMGIPNLRKATEFYTEFIKQDAVKAEWDAIGAIPLSWYAMGGYQMHFSSANKQIRQPKDFAGLKIIANDKLLTQLFADNNCAVIAQPPANYFEGLEKNVASGVLNSYSIIKSYGVTDLINMTVEFGEGLQYNMFVMAISKKSWDSLPADIQQLFIDIQKEWIEGEVARNEQLDDTAKSEMKKDHVKVRLTADELAVWKETVLPYHDMTIKELEDSGKKETRNLYNFIRNYFDK